MKGAAEYAKRLKRLLSSLKKKRGKSAGAGRQAASPVIEHLVVAILEENASRTAAKSSLDSLLACMVDYNDLRVTTPRDMLALMDKSLPEAAEKADRISSILNHVYQNRNSLNLDYLRDKPVRDVKQFLNLLEGMTPFVYATVIQRGIGAHAIPVDEITVGYLREQEFIAADASAPEIEAFLERHIRAADADVFCAGVRPLALAHARKIRAREARTMESAAPARKRAKSATSNRTRTTGARKSSRSAPSRSAKRVKTSKAKVAGKKSKKLARR